MRRFVLFDFDGVIADSFALSFKVASMMHPHLTEEQYIRMWDGNIFDDGKEFACTPECRDGDFYTVYSPLSKEIGLIEGSAGFLETLAADHTLAVISSSLTVDVMEIAERNGIAHHFSDVLGKDVHTSKLEKLNTILERYSATPSDCVFITDTLGDMREAGAAGIGAIGVAWGFQPAERLRSGDPFRVVSAPSELYGAVHDYFSRVPEVEAR